LIESSDRLVPSIAARLLLAEMERETDVNSRCQVASALATVSIRLGPAESARICGRAIDILSTSMPQVPDWTTRNDLVSAVVRLSATSEPAKVARTLARELTKPREGFPYPDGTLVAGLSTVVARLDPPQAARICGEAAESLAKALRPEGGGMQLNAMMDSLSSICTLLEPDQSTRIWEEVARALLTALKRQETAAGYDPLVERLREVSARLGASRAAYWRGQAARFLAEAMEREKDADVCAWLASNLPTWGVWLPPDQASRFCNAAIRKLTPYLERMPSNETPGFFCPSIEWIPFASSRMNPAQAAPVLAASLERAANAAVRRQLLLGLASAVRRTDPTESDRIYRQAARTPIEAFERETDAPTRRALMQDIVSVVSRLDSAEAVQICGEAAEVLANAFTREKDPWTRSSLASAVARISTRLGPADSARICGQLARALRDELEREKDDSVRDAQATGLVWLAGLMEQPVEMDPSVVSHPLIIALVLEARGEIRGRLASLAGRSDPAEAARIYNQAAHVIAASLQYEKYLNRRNELVTYLKSLAGWLDSSDSTRLLDPVARLLAGTLAREPRQADHSRPEPGINPDPDLLSWTTSRLAPEQAALIVTAALKEASNPFCIAGLARILSATVDRLGDAEADRICQELISSLDREAFDLVAPTLLEQLDQEKAHALAWDLASRLCSEPEFDTKTFSRILTDNGREQRIRRAAFMALAGLGVIGAPDAAARIATGALRCRLTTQELVELLKMPTCFGVHRRIVLHHLGLRYRRRFVNHWEFVRFATERGLGLDFRTPPRRYGPTGPLDRRRSRNPENSASRLMGRMP
jgi:hypothetical protein